ncbi:MAG TPA: hypothetical protein VGQ73_03045 [Gemmatimonadales bacterium]|nr:hypothetical protein [Gemmatimonadales bacterium]
MDALLERLALIYCLLAMLVAPVPDARLRALAAAGVCLLGLAAAADEVAASATAGQFANLNELLALAGSVVALTGIVLGFRRREPEIRPASTVSLMRLDPLLLTGLGLAALAPHLLWLGLGVLFALVAAARTTLRARRLAWLLLLTLAVGLLGSAFALMFTILGPESARLERLGEGPFSPAAERLLGLLLGASSLLLAGVPPLHRVPWGRALAPLAALLIARLVVPDFPLGLATWQVPAMALLVAGLAAAAWSGHWPQAVVAGGLLALWSGLGGVSAGYVLVAWGWLVETGTALLSQRGIALRTRWAALPAIPAALAALPALTAGLSAQVLLSVAAVGGCAAGFVIEWKRGARELQAPLY